MTEILSAAITTLVFESADIHKPVAVLLTIGDSNVICPELLLADGTFKIGPVPVPPVPGPQAVTVNAKKMKMKADAKVLMNFVI
jgi:hypothetical protein